MSTTKSNIDPMFQSGDHVRPKTPMIAQGYSCERHDSYRVMRSKTNGHLFILNDKGERVVLERLSAPTNDAHGFEVCDAPSDVAVKTSLPKGQSPKPKAPQKHTGMTKVTEDKSKVETKALPIDLDFEEYDYIGTRYPAK